MIDRRDGARRDRTDPWFVHVGPWRVLAAVIGGGVALGYAFLAYHHGWTFGRTDFQIYRTGTQIALDGGSPYGESMLPLGPFLYPPFAAIAMAGFTFIPLHLGQTIWVVTNLAAFCTTAWIVVSRFELPRPELRRPLAAALAVLGLCLAPVWLTVTYGQVNIVLLLLIVADVLVEQPRWPRGLLVGIAVGIKLTPAIFVIWWLLTGRRRAALVAGATFLTTVGLGLLLMRDVGIEYWRHIALELPPRLDLSYILNQSAYAMFLRFDAPAPRTLALLIAVPLVAAALWRARGSYRAGDEVTAVAICGAASVLIAPVSWVHHGVWLSVAVMALVGRAIRARDARVLVVAAAVFVASVSYFCRLGDWWINRHDWSLAPALIREWFFFMGVGIVLLLPYGPSRRTRAERAEEARHSDTPSVSGRLVTVGGAR